MTACAADGCTEPRTHTRLCVAHLRAQLDTPKPPRTVEERRSTLLAQYDLTPADYARMLAEQGNVCAICGGDDLHLSRGLAVDHDHLTGEVRGLLCGNCNTALGLMRDDPDRLRAAADYLESTPGHRNRAILAETARRLAEL